ncbi:MAG: PQQ-binding-like beta-propeller repeat protein [Rhodospirillales bacterium]
MTVDRINSRTGILARSCCAVFLAAALLTGCEFQEKGKAPLEGKRIPVLLHERTISADSSLSNESFLLPAPVVNQDWPQAGGYPNHAMHHLAVGDALKRVWKVNIGSGADDEQRFTATPIVASGILYAMDVDHQLSAYRTEDGKRLWVTDLANETDGDDDHIPGGIAFYRGQVFATTGFGDVVAVNAETGEVAWRENFKSPLRAAPSARAGRVIVVTLDSRVLALNVINGETLWSFESIGEGASVLGAASPAIDGNTVVVPFASGEILALDIETGRVLWSDFLSAVSRTDTVSNLSQIRGHPVIDRGQMISISHGGMMASFDITSGQRNWEREVGGIDMPWVAGDVIFVLTNDAEVAAMQRNSGRIYWVTGLPLYEDPEDKEDSIVWSGPVLAGNRLIVTGSHGEAWALSPYTGTILGRVELPSGVTVPPIVAGGTVFFLADNADVTAYR